MLTLTTQAAAEIRNLIEQPEVPEGGGLRIANDATAGSLTLRLAALPAEDDEVLDTSGARLFLDPQAAVLLDDKTLDVAPDPEGSVQFTIAEQSG
jgi:Fe-S cluster assembly iron-binding protein IscA